MKLEMEAHQRVTVGVDGNYAHLMLRPKYPVSTSV